MSGPRIRKITIMGRHDDVYLTVRKPKHEIRGSMLLTLKGKRGVWDCVRCQESTHEHYTEKEWMNRYDEVFGFNDDSEEAEMIAEHKDFIAAPSKYRAPKDKGDGLINADECVLSAKTNRRIERAKWSRRRHEVELLLVKEFPKSDEEHIAHIEYTSILLTFALFDDDNNKQVRPGVSGAPVASAAAAPVASGAPAAPSKSKN